MGGLEAALERLKGTTMGHGAEFRDPEELRPLLGKHPHFDFFEGVLREGMKFWGGKERSTDECKRLVEKAIEYGNHRSAKENEEEVMRLLQKDVGHGFALVLPVEYIFKIPKALVQPCGIVVQQTLDSEGNQKPKRRLTHDASFAFDEEGSSVNDFLDLEMYPELIYGFCLSRVINFIVSLRFDFPETKIYIAKYDYSDAYRRITYSASAALQQILVVAGLAYVMLRLTFGGSANPPAWCAFSEMVADLANEMHMSQDWDPDEEGKKTLGSIPDTKDLPKDLKMGKAREPALKVPTDVPARTDCFIDDLISVALGIEEF